MTLTVADVAESGGGDIEIANSDAINITGLVSAGPGDVTIATAGQLIENGGAVDGFVLTTYSVGGTELTGPNTVQYVRATANAGGDYGFDNTSSTLVVIGVTEIGDGALRISNAGSMNIVGLVTAESGNVTLSASGTVIEDNNGMIVAAGLELLGNADYTLTNADNLVTNLAGNTAGNVVYHNAGSLAVGTVNTIGLTAANKSIQLTADGSIGVNAILDGGSIGLTAAGQLTENGGAIDASTLTTNAAGGTELAGPNSVQSLDGTNSGGGDFDFGNSTSTLVVTEVNQVDGGNIRVTNAGSINLVGAVSTVSGNVTLSGSGSVFESGLGKIAAAGLELLGSANFTLVSTDNLVTNLAGNTTGNVAYHNAGGLLISTVNSAGLSAGNGSIELTANGSIGVNAILRAASSALRQQDNLLKTAVRSTVPRSRPARSAARSLPGRIRCSRLTARIPPAATTISAIAR